MGQGLFSVHHLEWYVHTEGLSDNLLRKGKRKHSTYLLKELSFHKEHEFEIYIHNNSS